MALDPLGGVPLGQLLLAVIPGRHTHLDDVPATKGSIQKEFTLVSSPRTIEDPH